MTIRRIILALLLVFSVGACTPEQIARYVDHVTEVTCQEDESCWDCPTMGNRTCGPDAPAWMQDGDPSTGPVE